MLLIILLWPPFKTETLRGPLKNRSEVLLYACVGSKLFECRHLRAQLQKFLDGITIFKLIFDNLSGEHGPPEVTGTSTVGARKALENSNALSFKKFVLFRFESDALHKRACQE